MKLDGEISPCDDVLSEVVESFYLETKEELFFAVKGAEHPPDRWIAVLRYAPDPEKGDRKKGGSCYRRLYSFAEQERWIKTSYPQYLAYDDVFQTTLQSVPRDLVQRIYDPRTRLKELTETPDRLEIHKEAAAFADLLQKEAAIPRSCLGVTGSLLIGMETEHSDLDIAVFGMRECKKTYRAMLKILQTGSCDEISRLDAQGTQELYAQRVTDTRMAFREFVDMEKRKVNQGRFRSRTYFVRFIKEAHESQAGYGRLRYTPLGRAAIEALIADDEDAIFTPCRYLLHGVRSLEGTQAEDLREIVSFRGRFCEQARTGETVRAAGTQERVQSDRGETWHRLLLGHSPEDIMVFI